MATAMHEGERAVQEQAGAVWNEAKEMARGKLSEQQQTAASSLGSFAQALRKSARELQGDQQQAGVARFAQSAADGLDRLSGNLRNKDLDGMLRDAEGLARRQPMLFFGAAVAAGFLAVRFLKSSNPKTEL
ncbi:MAG: hypothetical protein ACREUN_11980 [Burkholderiales bacterium]